jgi:hypothetical protein
MPSISVYRITIRQDEIDRGLGESGVYRTLLAQMNS